MTIDDRSQQIVQLREQGYTLKAIADQFGITRQRVHQLILKAQGRDPYSPGFTGRGALTKSKQFQLVRKDAQAAALGDRLVFIRRKRGMSLGELSQLSGIPHGILGSYEGNLKEPSCDNLRKICQALRASAHWLLFGKSFQSKKNSN